MTRTRAQRRVRDGTEAIRLRRWIRFKPANTVELLQGSSPPTVAGQQVRCERGCKLCGGVIVLASSFDNDCRLLPFGSAVKRKTQARLPKDLALKRVHQPAS